MEPPPFTHTDTRFTNPSPTPVPQLKVLDRYPKPKKPRTDRNATVFPEKRAASSESDEEEEDAHTFVGAVVSGCGGRDGGGGLGGGGAVEAVGTADLNRAVGAVVTTA
jgi:hypothetical protein